MDFGDILDEWDRRTARSPGRPAGPSAGKKKPEERRTDPLTAWLRTNEIYDKDAAREEGIQSAAERRRRLLRKRPDAAIDLHGLTRDEAWKALEDFFQNARRRKFEKLLLIHGKGNHSPGDAILKRTCREVIERCPFDGDSGCGWAESGGTGSTWVLLK
ncbi:MAG: Smr/MutS family protein [Spirochaetaceae bacterium]|jgi:DNA-nicking Smr family endonuclease|nr:Smr/MutS family protein [Spirochaetaceae bacterium]